MWTEFLLLFFFYLFPFWIHEKIIASRYVYAIEIQWIDWILFKCTISLLNKTMLVSNLDSWNQRNWLRLIIRLTRGTKFPQRIYTYSEYVSMKENELDATSWSQCGDTYIEGTWFPPAIQPIRDVFASIIPHNIYECMYVHIYIVSFCIHLLAISIRDN